MVEGAKKKMSFVSEAMVESIKSLGNGNFQVGDRGKTFEVDFGDSSTVCSCSCPEYQRERVLCRHFYAVFRSQHNYSWGNVSVLYTESPLLCLDVDEEEPSIDCNFHQEPAQTNPPIKSDNGLPIRRNNFNVILQETRSTLRQLLDLTYRLRYDFNMVKLDLLANLYFGKLIHFSLIADHYISVWSVTKSASE